MRIGADWIWPGRGKAISGQLELAGDRVLGIASRPPAGVRAGRSTLLLPGLVNAHVHLDLTFEPERPSLERAFTEWLLGVRDMRRRVGERGLAEAIRRGALRSLAAGTTLLVDYDATGLAPAALADLAIRRVLLREVISFEGDAAARLAHLDEYLERATGAASEVRGVAPHAPYTVHPDVIDALVSRASSADAPWSMHVAERADEEAFLRDGAGEIAEFLRRVGLGVDSIPLPRTSGVGYLRARGWLARRPLLVHCNYLGDDDVAAIAAAGAAVVYCPRSHAWFGHAPHPLPRLLAAGIDVALGTDGLISNGSLSLVDEMRAVRAAHPSIPAPRILEMATAAGHRALRGRFGSGLLSPGEPADVVAIDVESGGGDILEDLLRNEYHVSAVWIGGRLQ